MPSRAASKGRQGCDDSRPSEWKPYNVVRQSESTPPTSAASHSPTAMARAALPNTFALEAQAADTTTAGPESSNDVPDVVRERIGVVRFAVVEIRRQSAVGVAPAIGELGFEDARGAGAEKHADAIAARSVPARRAPRSDKPSVSSPSCAMRLLRQS